MSKVTKGVIGAVAALVLFAGGYVARGQFDTHHFLYICPGSHRESNCVNGQELEVFDANGAPIYSVGEAGGDAVFGDNRSVFPPYLHLPVIASVRYGGFRGHGDLVWGWLSVLLVPDSCRFLRAGGRVTGARDAAVRERIIRAAGAGSPGGSAGWMRFSGSGWWPFCAGDQPWRPEAGPGAASLT